MSYDIVVFNPASAPKTRMEFMNWYGEQTKWTEGHSYNDPIITSDELRSWFMEMITVFRAMNGPHAVDDSDNELVSDYCIGRDVIYVAFAWSIAEKAYETMKYVAEKHKVGFFDASANDGDILFPDGNGMNKPIDRLDNLSSIQQIKSSASSGQQNASVQEILYSKLNIKNLISSSRDRLIECPNCEWQPDGTPYWQCSCGHTWNTFDTAAKCPNCGIQWEDTHCPNCEHSSPHKEWYIDSKKS